ncbi:chemotaxis protein CheB [Thermaurantimonas aggregans]|uniref:chemotaxis protein CheB n=1 Tax=Thermaurantimonas aggregans TaxID=2173829 RepID=UPI0023F20B08|nr:chemotaxis protein CheB [Thermaurantimonas aggregans]MCX8149060.1 PAS domain-containing protein [Thermaurantimonas aggregans]
MKTKNGKQNLPEYVVGIGASAGGLEALQEFFKNVPTKSGLAYVVVQHLSPDYKSLMNELLARFTSIPIQIIEDGMVLEADHIYLIPPKKNLTVFHGKLLLEEHKPSKGINLPIDIFFRSLASDYGKKAIGIILSGTGSDGTLGIKAIKEAGGMVMVQDEKTAKFYGMPKSSIATGVVDFILPPSKMPEAIINYIKHPFIENKNGIEEILTQNIDQLAKIMHILREYSGIDFSYYKENTIIRRLERRMSINRLNSLDEYLILLSSDDNEKDILYREFLIGVTRFFRDEGAFEFLKDQVLPELLSKDKKSVRIWSVGCSTGEEVYSIALLVRDFIDTFNLNIEVKIFATDIDKTAIEIAGQGVYAESVVSDIDPVLLSKYFIKKDNTYQISESIRKMVIFATHNVLKDPPFSKINLIVCRNLFIYLKPDSQYKVLNMFYMSLSHKGILFLGTSETLGDLSEAFEPINVKYKIFRKKEGYQPVFIPESNLSFQTNNRLSREPRTGLLREVKRQSELSEKIINAVLPPSIVVNNKLQILQIINDINPFVTIQSGRFNQNLGTIIHPDLQIVINNIIRRLKNEGDVVSFENIKFEHLADSYDIQGTKISDSEAESIYLISFYKGKAKKQQKQSEEVLSLEDHYHDRVKELEYELQFVKESLQATLEELETSNEELQSSNEELIAANEELQSTNEELQSVNEELYTVNSEFQSKIDELTQLNSDITNLLNNTGIAALYLDRKMCIRKITPSFSELSHVMDFDIGRPIHHFSNSILYPEFLNDIKSVQKDLQIIEKEIEIGENNYYLLRIAPYRTDFQAVDGILVTLTNLKNIHEQRKALETANQRLQMALEMGNMAWWEWDVQTGQVNMHEKKATMLGYSPEEFPKEVYAICEYLHPEDYERTMQAMRDHLEGKSPMWDIVYRIRCKDGSYKKYHDRGGVVTRDDSGKPLKMVGIVMDVTNY